MAAESHTLTQVIIEILRHAPWLGWQATADSVASGSITDVSELSHSGQGSGQFKDRWIYRYGLTGNDRKKRATTVTSAGVLSHGSSSTYSDTSDLTYMLLAMDPDELIGLIQNATRKIRLKTLTALSGARVAGSFAPVHDFDMEADSTGVYWGVAVALGSSSANNLTPSKVATDLYSGTKSLKLTASGSSGYSRGEKLRVNPGSSIYSAAICRADVGTIGFTWYDVTNGSNFSQAAITHTGETYALLERVDTIPSGCEEIQPVFTLSDASDVGYVDCVFGPYENGQMMFDLPTWLDETYELKALRLSRFRSGIGAASGVYDAYSRVFTENWTQPNYFELENFNRDMASARVQLQPDYRMPSCPVWISTERTMIDVEPLSSETSTTTVPLDQLVAYSMVEILEDVVGRSDKPFYQQELQKWRQKTITEEIARPSLPRPQPRHRSVLRA